MKIVYINLNGEQLESEVPDPPHSPLEGLGLAATLNAVLGVWTLEEASVVSDLPPETLIAEAESWAAAMNNVDSQEV
jgi:hypothetical protein